MIYIHFAKTFHNIIIGGCTRHLYGERVRNVGEERSEKDDFRDVEMLTNLEKSITKSFPFELWFKANEEEHIAIECRSLVPKKLVCRPYNAALYPIHEFDRGTHLCINKKVFRFDLCDLLWVPAI